jgi:AraC-like DNA-binding protein
MIRFGSMSIVLLCGALYGAMRAAMLCFIPANRAANRLLAALIGVLALFTVPYIIGYAGYYDAYPWLSYFPYNLTLAIGPLLYLYLACVSDGGGIHLPPRWALHLAPAMAQLLYYSILFAQPLAFKNSWDARVHVPLVDPAETLAMLASLAAYWTLALRRYRSRGAPLEWARNLLVALGLTITFWLALTGAESAWSGLTYFQRFPFYLWLAILVGYLGTEGYRHGTAPFPARTRPEAAAAAPAPAPAPADLAERWRATIIEQQWWRDPELTLATLARRLGTNTTTLSRAINEGLGLNFNEMVNRLRVAAVIAALQQDDGRPVLDIALSEGFNSKASFNRVFKLYTGETPTEYRRRPVAPAQVSTSG